jgi:hypothetical protein
MIQIFFQFEPKQENRKDFVCDCSQVTVLFISPMPIDNVGNVQNLKKTLNIQVTMSTIRILIVRMAKSALN